MNFVRCSENLKEDQDNIHESLLIILCILIGKREIRLSSENSTNMEPKYSDWMRIMSNKSLKFPFKKYVPPSNSRYST